MITACITLMRKQVMSAFTAWRISSSFALRSCRQFYTFGPDGHTLLTTGADGTARLWEVASRQAIITLYDHSGAVRSGAFSPNGSTLITTGDDGAVQLWDTVSHQLITALGEHNGTINKLAFSPDDRTLATANEDGTAQLWDIANRHR